MTCQRNWLYLESIFSAPDIQRQLPAEAKMFMQVDKSWKEIMRKVINFIIVIIIVVITVIMIIIIIAFYTQKYEGNTWKSITKSCWNLAALILSKSLKISGWCKIWWRYSSKTIALRGYSEYRYDACLSILVRGLIKHWYNSCLSFRRCTVSPTLFVLPHNLDFWRPSNRTMLSSIRFRSVWKLTWNQNVSSSRGGSSWKISLWDFVLL